MRLYSFFFFTHTPTTDIYTLSLHDALPISLARKASWTAGSSMEKSTASNSSPPRNSQSNRAQAAQSETTARMASSRSEEHTSELQSRQYLVCRLLLEKKKRKKMKIIRTITK